MTAKPGLIGALVVGINFAKTLALALNKPLIEVDHLHAHIFAPFLQDREMGTGTFSRKKRASSRIKFPFIGLVVSGGHTDIYLVKDFDDIKLVGATQDDAAAKQ